MENENRKKRSLNRMFKGMFQQRKEKKIPRKDNPESLRAGARSRRELIKNLAVIPVLGIPFFGIVKKNRWTAFPENSVKKAKAVKAFDISNLQGIVPKGKIKHLEISRLIPGGNQVSGIVSSPDLLYLTDLVKNYYTEEKAIEYLELCEACGINTAILRCDDHIIRILKEYWRRGGKIQWLAQTYPENEDITNIKIAVDTGAVGAFVMGRVAEKLISDKRLDCLAKDIEYIRSQGLIAGTAGHQNEVPPTCIKNGIEPDFFMKTFHHIDYPSAPGPDDKGASWEKNPGEVSAFFKTCKIPWIAYKVLAKGAIKPESALEYVFENGADFACVGMFDFQVVNNVNTAYRILNSDLKRERKWYA